VNYKKGIFEGNCKPSSVIPFPPFSENQEDGHLSRALIAQGLKRPYPSRLYLAATASRQIWMGNSYPPLE